jgi:hypothetical protein
MLTVGLVSYYREIIAVEDPPPHPTDELEPDPGEFIERDLTDNGLAEGERGPSQPTGT